MKKFCSLPFFLFFNEFMSYVFMQSYNTDLCKTVAERLELFISPRNIFFFLVLCFLSTNNGKQMRVKYKVCPEYQR